MYVQVNSAISNNARLRKTGEIKQLVEEYNVQVVGLVELGFNWSLAPPLANLASWFNDWKDCSSVTSHSTMSQSRE